MYCPRCGAEYREGFAECSDCRKPLVNQPVSAELIARGREWVPVLLTGDKLVFKAAIQALREGGIETRVYKQLIISRVTPAAIQVHRVDEPDATKLLEMLTGEADLRKRPHYRRAILVVGIGYITLSLIVISRLGPFSRFFRFLLLVGPYCIAQALLMRPIQRLPSTGHRALAHLGIFALWVIFVVLMADVLQRFGA